MTLEHLNFMMPKFIPEYDHEERQARRLATQVNLTRPRTAAELRNRLVDHLRFNLIESLQLQIMSILKHSIWLKILTQP